MINKLLLFLQPNTVKYRFLRSSISVYLSVIFLIELQPCYRVPPPPQFLRQSTTISLVLFLETCSIPYLRLILIWNRISCSLCFFKVAFNPPPPHTHTHTYSHTIIQKPPSSISPSFFPSGLRNPSYPTNTPNRVYLSWLTPPPPCFNNVYYQLNTSLSVSSPLAPAYILYSFVLSFETISICLKVMWNQDE